MKRTLKALFNIATYIIITGALIWGLPKGLSWALQTPYPMATVTSGSMWPVLKENDLVFIQGVSREKIRAGDIVVWRNPRGFTIHRLVRSESNTFVTKGDANFNEDAPVAYDALIGRALTLGQKPVRIPYVGFIAIAASKYAQEIKQ